MFIVNCMLSEMSLTFHGDNNIETSMEFNHPKVLFDTTSIGRVRAIHVFLRMTYLYTPISNGISSLHIEVSYSEALLENCTFENIKVKHMGNHTTALLTSWNSYISIMNCTFRNNSARDGIIFAEESYIVVNQTMFALNRAYCGSGFCLRQNTHLMINENTFLKNQAILGGAVYAENLTSLVINKSQFHSNKAVQCAAFQILGTNASIWNSNFTENAMIAENSLLLGAYYTKQQLQDGAIINIADNGILTVKNCSFFNNSGSAIYALRSLLQVQSVNFSSNGAKHGPGILASLSVIQVTKALFHNNVATTLGSITILHNSTLIATETCFSGNMAQYGSAISIKYNSFLNITKSTFKKNYAFYMGSIYVQDGVHGHIRNCSFQNNIAVQGAALSMWLDVKLAIEFCSFIENEASKTIVDDMNPKSLRQIFQTPQNLINYKTKIQKSSKSHTNTKKQASGGAISRYQNVTVIIDTCRFTKNKAGFSFGAVFVGLNSSSQILSSLFTNNTAPQGAAVGLSHTTEVLISNTTFRYNFANQTAVVYIYSVVSMKVTNCCFSSNQAEQKAGVFLINRVVNVTIANSTMYNNNSPEGAVLYAVSSNVKIYNCSIVKNSAFHSGLLMFGQCKGLFSEMEITLSSPDSLYLIAMVDSDFEISHLRLSNNTSKYFQVDSHSAIRTSLIFIQSSRVQVQDCTISNNSNVIAFNVAPSSLVFIMNTNFTDNLQAGFLASQDVSRFWMGTVIIKNNTGSKVLLLLARSNLTVNDSTFYNNFVEKNGGIIHSTDSNISIELTNFTNNSVMGDGAVLYVEGNFKSNAKLIRSIFINNQAHGDGAVIYGETFADIALDSCTLVGNKATSDTGIFVMDFVSLRTSNVHFEISRKPFIFMIRNSVLYSQFINYRCTIGDFNHSLLMDAALKLKYIEIVNVTGEPEVIAIRDSPFASGRV